MPKEFANVVLPINVIAIKDPKITKQFEYFCVISEARTNRIYVLIYYTIKYKYK